MIPGQRRLSHSNTFYRLPEIDYLINGRGIVTDSMNRGQGDLRWVLYGLIIYSILTGENSFPFKGQGGDGLTRVFSSEPMKGYRYSQ